MQNLKRTDEQSYGSATLKEQQLRKIFRELGSVVVAYSGGVDSSYVAYVANAELGPRAICITGQSASLPSYQQAEIDRVVNDFGFHHEVIQTEELDNPSYQANNPDSCTASSKRSPPLAESKPLSMVQQSTTSTISAPAARPRSNMPYVVR
jgi:NH3-dependent NAD+ synthetase